MTSRLGILLTWLACAASACASDPVPIVLDDDGAWCWFQDERAIVHDGRLYVGTVSSGKRSAECRGDINVVIHDFASGETRRVELHDQLQCDDHDNPALLARPDGRVLAVYTMHGSDALVRSRLSDASDPYHFGPEQAYRVEMQDGHGVTYSNLYRLSDENDGRGRLYNFHRGDGWDPSSLVSEDDGVTWTVRGQLLHGPGRPYVRYASNDRDTIHFICTDQHPRDADNSIYHGFVRNGRVHRSDGTVVGTLGTAPARPKELTRLFAGDADNVAWTSNIEMTPDGHPVAVYSVQKNSAGLPVGQGGDDCRYRYARWDGERWHDHPVAYAGRRLYRGEDDYTGLICVDPHDVDTVYFSTDADPVSGTPLISEADGRRHHEIFRGHTSDGGVTWTFAPITQDSTADNLRPLVAHGDPAYATLLWLRGRYTSMYDFDQAVMALRLGPPAAAPSRN